MLSLDALTFHTATAALEQGCVALAAGATEFDLAGVKAADSAGVAVMVAWERRARQLGRNITYKNVPPGLHTLVHLYGLDALLPQD